MVSSDIPIPVPSKEFDHVLFTIGLALHGRNREMTTLQYLNGMVLLHGGCTQRVSQSIVTYIKGHLDNHLGILQKS